MKSDQTSPRYHAALVVRRQLSAQAFAAFWLCLSMPALASAAPNAPAANAPAANDSAANDSAANDPAANDPAANDPAANDPASNDRATSDRSQSPSQPGVAWTLQVDPLTTAIGFVHLQVERALHPRWSVYAGPHLRLFDSLLEDKKEPYTGVGVEIGVRYFFSGTAPAGLWAQIRGVVARLSTDIDGGSTAMGGYGSALVGHTWIFQRRWVLAGGLGAQYLHYRVGKMGPKQWFVAAHSTVGVAF